MRLNTRRTTLFGHSRSFFTHYVLWSRFREMNGQKG